MRRKRLLLFAVFVAAVLVAGYFLIPVGEGQISQASCDRIQLRMNEKQVYDALGHSRSTRIVRHFDDETTTYLVAIAWQDEDFNEILVHFDNTRCVTGKCFSPTYLSFSERLKRRIQRRLKAVWP
jgi:hypothetical protein